MIFKRYEKADIDTMTTLLAEGLRQFHYAGIDFSYKKLENLLVGNLRNPSFFCDVVIADDGQIAGALCASVQEFMFSHEVYAEHHVTYIREEYRSLKAVTGLVMRYVAWARKRDARQVRWGQSTGYKMDKFAVLAKRLGFTQIGTNWSMEL